MSKRQLPTQPRALFIRLDRIGDLVLTLPVDQRLRDIANGYDIHWWIPPRLGFVTQAAVPPRVATEITKSASIYDVFHLFRTLRRESFSLAVVFHAPWWVGFILWLARVPVRVGVRSQWHSFLFFNRGVRQKRSRAEKNEFDYNLDLVEKGLQLSHHRVAPLELKPVSRGALTRNGLSPKNYDVVHPGMGGSALNWPMESYRDLILRLRRDRPVVVTGTVADRFILEPLKTALSAAETGAAGSPIIWLNEKLSGEELLEVLDGARAVVAPSTGVVHLAAALGVPTVGIYSPIRVEHPTRWGPKGARAEALVSELRDGEDAQSAVARISVDQVVAKISELAKR